MRSSLCASTLAQRTLHCRLTVRLPGEIVGNPCIAEHVKVVAIGQKDCAIGVVVDCVFGELHEEHKSREIANRGTQPSLLSP